MRCSPRRFPAFEVRTGSLDCSLASLTGRDCPANDGAGDNLLAAGCAGAAAAGWEVCCCSHVCISRRDDCGTSRKRIPVRPLEVLPRHLAGQANQLLLAGKSKLEIYLAGGGQPLRRCESKFRHR